MRASPTAETFPVRFVDEDPVDTELRVAIFDGGLPAEHPFPSCVVGREAPGVTAPTPAGLRHGLQVTSALLYGPLAEGELPPTPYAAVDHWRVLDEDGDDFELMTTLDRIMDVLEQNTYEVVSLSIGPDEALFDDDVHVWTSRLDQFAASGKTLIISAAGNNGSMDVDTGLCRIQPASDGVNVLAVGAADQSGESWARAGYSARGPGRSPGLVKPDILAFGGSEDEPFFTADAIGIARGVTGTSFAAPAAARLGLGLKALFGSQLSPLAVKALLVHHAACDEHSQLDVGWGRVPSQLDDVATCLPGEATVVYQGVLEPARYRRFLLPVPTDGFGGTVTLRATFVTATAVDPEDAINYTRTGVGITFRPKTTGHPGYTTFKGVTKERAAHQSKAFFGKSALFETEQTLRDDAQRWEATLKASHSYRPSTLDQPVFDIEHLARANGQAAPRGEAVQYALIVTIAERGSNNLYNRIVRSYAGRLQTMRPQVEIPIRTRS
nr:S8 family peptidase [Sphingomonas aerophila]